MAAELHAYPEAAARGKRPFVGDKRRSEITFGPDMLPDPQGKTPEQLQEAALHIMAVQTAGLNLRQMEQIVRMCWRNDQPVDFQVIRQHKQRAIEEAYGGLVDFIEPENGFEVIGGHENIKEYGRRKVIGPLQRGDKRTCSKGFVMAGPPGTGKTALALAMAKESKMNFLQVRLDRVFGGVVGETETKTGSCSRRSMPRLRVSHLWTSSTRCLLLRPFQPGRQRHVGARLQLDHDLSLR